MIDEQNEARKIPANIAVISFAQQEAVLPNLKGEVEAWRRGGVEDGSQGQRQQKPRFGVGGVGVAVGEIENRIRQLIVDGFAQVVIFVERGNGLAETLCPSWRLICW
ncbi:MAG: hypothetical protein HY231_18290 [Acidobacteria bacterium]|nr:hypothetical protein [Acidobacteriota bacterium]